MAIVFDRTPVVAVGKVAELGGRRNRRAENVIRSLEAGQRQAMQAASLQAAFDQQANMLSGASRTGSTTSLNCSTEPARSWSNANCNRSSSRINSMPV